MGDPKKSRKRWQGPRHPWKKDNLTRELSLLGKYGLRNKRELWRANSIIKSYRNQASAILALEANDRAIKEKDLLKKLSKLGLLNEDAVLDNVLDLSVNEILERRLQTILLKLNIAKTLYQARQLIVHGHISISDRSVSAPGYLVSRDEESNIKCKIAVPVEAVPMAEKVA
jgi:small subunit ribosomal protein S4